MGRLAGFSYREVTRKLKKLGFEFYGAGKGDYEIWLNPDNKLRTIVPHHRQVKEGTLRSILKQAQIEVEDFLRA